VIAPGPSGHALFGELLPIRRDRLEFVTRMRREFGDFARFRMGFRVAHLVSHPDAVGHVLQDNHKNYRKGIGLAQAKRWLGEGLVTSEGEAWARQRRLIQPAFQRQRLAGFSPVVTAATAAMLDRWSAEPGRSVDVASQMMRLTLEVITRVMFSASIANSSEIGAAFTTTLHDAMDRMTALASVPDWLPSAGNLRFRRALRTLHAMVDAIIIRHRRHRDHGGMHDDLLTRLSEGEGTQDGLGDRELRDQVLTMLLVGHETTASSLAWTFYLIASHPWVWPRLKEEVDRVLGGRVPTHNDLSELVWMRRVFDESMRLYPPVWLIPRQAINADEVGGYPIPAGSEVLISPYVLHRHPDYWERPDEFDPERFSAEPAEKQRRYTYLPFGAGPRACVGSALASMEALLILAMVTQRCRLDLVPGFEVVPEPLLTLRFRHGLAMTPGPPAAG
jgi:enediyne biosynthesis protein E7